MPLYVDAFSKKELKTTFMSSILLAPPVGVLIGYGLTATTIGLYENWRMSFVIQGFTMGLSLVFISLVPGRFLDIQKVNLMKAKVNK